LAGRAVAVIGGATAGAEAAAHFAKCGAWVVVYEQNPRPYGKIEDGLPVWHEKLRRKEFDAIVGKLDHPGVDFVPNTRIGRDLDFDALAAMDFHAVILANGAWRDRPYPVADADAYLGKGLLYQNPFVIAFNHANDPSYQGPRFPILDNTLVVGGGLASIDVCKILMLDTVRLALAARGIREPMLEIELKGIPRILQRHDTSLLELGVYGCTLFHRGSVSAMPVVQIPPDADAERREKAHAARRRLISKAIDKYRFRLVTCALPDNLLSEGDRLVGLRMRQSCTEDDETFTPLEETHDFPGAGVVSSIGSIPEHLSGIAMDGELYAFSRREVGQLKDHPHVFAAGNVATGRGNIVASRQHGGLVAEHVVEAFLGLGESGHDGEEAMLSSPGGADPVTLSAADWVSTRPAIGGDAERALRSQVAQRQREVGYEGDLRAWIEKVTPPGFV
jgi:thioredoxin reductase